MFIRNYLLIILLTAPLLFPQSFQRELNTIPFFDADGALKNIFSGGINNFEFQFVDIDGDGDKDLFFLDSDNTFGLYVNTGSNTQPEFSLSLTPPPGLFAKNWFYLADIDADSDFDLFTNGTDNFIQYYSNTGSSTSPVFTLTADPLKDENGVPIFTEFSSNPLFSDIDADGDLDFFSGNSAGTVTFYENIGTPNQFSFRFITDEWEDLLIISTDNQRHGASSLEFADIDNDGDNDLFWGDFFSKSLYFIENQGTPNTPDMEVILRIYPPNADSIQTSGFNMPRLIDIDADNDLDLFVSVLYDPTVPQSLIFLRNEGSSTLPDFNFITSNYLPTLDAGTESTPHFCDLDSDGDLDLFIGSSKNPSGTLYYFENTGNVNDPVYFLRDSIFAGISGELSIAPALADMDGDGDLDLLIGNFDGTIGYYINEGTKTLPDFVFSGFLPDHNQQIIDVGLTARPFLKDIDGDSDQDLVLGSFNGSIELFWNNGTHLKFLFVEEPLYFESIDVGDNSTPFLLDIDGNGVLDLFTGNRAGELIYFKNNGTNVLPDWVFVTNHFIEGFSGGITVPVFSDIDNDTDFDLFIGNIKGGLYFFRNTLISSLHAQTTSYVPDFSLAAYPNPFNSQVKFEVNISTQDFYKILIYNSIGEIVYNIYTDNLIPGKYSFSWNGRNNFNYPAASGNYIVAVTTSRYALFRNIILLK